VYRFTEIPTGKIARGSCIRSEGVPRSYYLAIEPPPVERARLSLVMRRLGNPSPLPHITVVEPPLLSPDLSWWDAVTNVAINTQPVEIEPQGVRTFDNRVLYLAVHAPSLTDLRRRLLDVTRPMATDPSSVGEAPPFVPHLTLAIARRGRPLADPQTIEPLVANLEAFQAIELTLFRRDIAAHGYRAWRRASLAAS
jgi:2'-5' RNA ligase